MQNPKHVAIIMDGNGRWADKKLHPRSYGHSRGVTTLKEIVQACPRHGIEILTVYAFSTENWKRPKREVNFLLKLLDKTFSKEIDQLYKDGARVKLIGDFDSISVDQQRIWETAEARTKNNTKLLLNVAFNYGGRNEIVNACQSLAQKVYAGILKPEEITESLFANELYTSQIDDPDLVIRTGGEYRLSNFLLWQAAYAEWYFTDILWPDFNEQELIRALASYGSRERRFGQVKDK